MNRYNVSGNEGLYQPNSGRQVLANKLDISDPDDIDSAELFLLEQLYISVFEQQFPSGSLTVEMLKRWHRRWLGNIYPWAGKERSVNISKEGFMFAPAVQITKLLHEFELRCLNRYTPCTGMNKAQLIEAIAVTHVELILIHPFREGNGRLSRLLADVMAVQGGSQPLDYYVWEQHKPRYISAIHKGVSTNYEPMEQLVSAALRHD